MGIWGNMKMRFCMALVGDRFVLCRQASERQMLSLEMKESRNEVGQARGDEVKNSSGYLPWLKSDWLGKKKRGVKSRAPYLFPYGKQRFGVSKSTGAM